MASTALTVPMAVRSGAILRHSLAAAPVSHSGISGGTSRGRGSSSLIRLGRVSPRSIRRLVGTGCGPRLPMVLALLPGPVAVGRRGGLRSRPRAHESADDTDDAAT